LNRNLLVLVALGALAVVPARASAQSSDRDVELLGQVYGTRPPEAYFELRENDPNAFRLERGMGAGRGMPASGVRSGPAALRAPGAPASIVLGTGRVQGTFRFPVVLGLFSDSPSPQFSPGQVQDYFFEGPNPTGTITELYREMSGGAVELRGEVKDWETSLLRGDSVARGTSGLGGSSRVGEFIMELLAELPETTDWGRYDNDGPDGRPNSGDDDGYVDILAVIQPTMGAECGGEGRDYRIWSHKWTLRSAVGQSYVTATSTPSGGRIRIDDYTIQPLLGCDGQGLSEIGVFAHELGHGFGLPDLYGGAHGGAGRWDLMGTGSWGCSSRFEPERPCHMGAWSKAMLGWLDVEWLPFGSTFRSVSLDPVESGGRALAIPSGDGSGEYFLLENRQRVGFDGAIPETGLLIWKIDPWWIDAWIEYNEVNEAPTRMGVWLMQADGRNELALGTAQGGNRGDAGDPFTGEDGKAAFHAGTNPKAYTNTKAVAEQQSRRIPAGSAAGATVTDIARVGERVTFRALSRYQTLRVRITGEDVSDDLLKVDGAPVPASDPEIRSAPYQTHTIEAAAGAALGDGIRRGFSGWEDAAGEGRVRSWTTGLADAELVARYGGPREVRFRVALQGLGSQVVPGTVTTVPASPDLWFDEGTQVAFQAQPKTGFEFRTWAGALTGTTNPALLLMDQPKDATATFQMVFGLHPNARVEFPALTRLEISLETRNANLPVRWTQHSGAVPEGMTLNRSGLLVGEALQAGEFPLELSVRDAIGLEASGTVTLVVKPAVFGTNDLAAQFLLGPGGLSDGQRRYLDLSGNQNGLYDLGDFRAYLLAHPDAPADTPPAASARRVVPLVDFGAPEGR
jgi:M6 family metalloprotease-like protein